MKTIKKSKAVFFSKYFVKVLSEVLSAFLHCGFLSKRTISSQPIYLLFLTERHSKLLPNV